MDQQLNSQQQELDKKICRDADELRVTMNTPGWQTIVQPLIDKMITDSMGCKKDGMWSEGALAHCNKAGIEVEKMIWYRKALIEFNNGLQNIIHESNRVKQRRAQKEAKDLEPEPEVMMPMHDTSYKDSPKIRHMSDKYSGGLTSG